MPRSETLKLFLILLVSFLASCQDAPSSRHFSQLLSQQGSKVTAPAKLRFPRDNNAHPDFGIEWWYLTANLTTDSGKPIWLQWTLFRINSQNKPGSWSDGQFYMAHLSLHSHEQHVNKELFADGGVGNVGISTNELFINNWVFRRNSQGLPTSFHANTTNIKGQNTSQVKLNLKTSPVRLLHGENGYSEKYPGTGLASFYYSLPRIEVSGEIMLDDEQVSVTGNAWYDHEWSSQFLSTQFEGWNWFSIHLEDGSKLMLFSLEPTVDKPKIWSGTLLTKDNQQLSLSSQDINVKELSWHKSEIGKLPQEWRINLPNQGIQLRITVAKKDQISDFSIPYYEGAVIVEGTTKGTGFVELTR